MRNDFDSSPALLFHSRKEGSDQLKWSDQHYLNHGRPDLFRKFFNFSDVLKPGIIYQYINSSAAFLESSGRQITDGHRIPEIGRQKFGSDLTGKISGSRINIV
jgi:hypothetical protein